MSKTKADLKNKCIKDILKVQKDYPDRPVTRDLYRKEGKIPEREWSGIFGTFGEFRIQAGLVQTRQQSAIHRQLAKHVSVDHYRKIGKQRKSWGACYLRDNKRRFKTVLGMCDIHDIEVDKFWLRVMLDTAKRAQPDLIVINGDLFDLSEFSRFTTDPREWDITKRIQFAHEQVLAPLRAACPEAQIDLIEGNHEVRLIKHLADQSPGMRSILSDLHGWTVKDLLKLDQHEMNYIAQADLGAYTQRDQKIEVKRNWKLYYNCLAVHHQSEGRLMGYPGFSGHNHKHAVWNGFSPQFGSFEWHQFGSGCKRDADYCEGQKWANGFGLIHVDTKTQSVNTEYVPVTDHAVVGGQWYYRGKKE